MNHDLRCGDAFDLIKMLPENSIHAVVTDPPYFLKYMGDGWDHDNLANTTSLRTTLPGGMAFDVRQGPELQAFMLKLSKAILPKLKPGGFFLSFSQARLACHMGVGIAQAGFEIRDMLAWVRPGDAKAMTPREPWVDDTADRKGLTARQKAALVASLEGRKTAMVKGMMEPIIFAQRPKEGSVTDNWFEHGTGLIDVARDVAGEFPGQLFAYPKPGAEERARGGNHRTQKPEALMRRLIEVFTREGDTILDPFLGSGTTGVAAVETGRKIVGIELDKEVFATARRRIKDATPKRISRPCRTVRPEVIDFDFANENIEFVSYRLEKAA